MFCLPGRAKRALSTEAAEAAPLLLLLARDRLNEVQVDLARQMADALPDWRTLTKLASGKLSLPFIYHHIVSLDLLPRDAPLRQALHMATLSQSARWLKLVAEQRNFFNACLAPVDIPHVFFKGISLTRYYPKPGLRVCRDIDVLVNETDLDTVLAAALGAGYRVLLDVNSGRLAKTARDLKAIRRYKTDVPLLSPSGAMIELHTALDKGKDIFETSDALARGEMAKVAGTEYRVLPTADLAVFLAYHHNRHVWSCLNWMGDFDALKRHRSWSEEAVRSRASELDLSEAVDATLAFNHLAGRPDLWAEAPAGPARESLELCLLTLEGGKETENAVIKENVHPATNWRVPKAQRRKATREAWQWRLTPHFHQYLAYPLPHWLHWLYPLEWAAGATRRLVTGQRNPLERARMTPPRR